MVSELFKLALIGYKVGDKNALETIGEEMKDLEAVIDEKNAPHIGVRSAFREYGINDAISSIVLPWADE